MPDRVLINSWCAFNSLFYHSHNSLSTTGARDIADMLIRTLALEDLDVSWNKVMNLSLKILNSLFKNDEFSIKYAVFCIKTE